MSRRASLSFHLETMRHVPKFVYTGGTLTLSVTQRPWSVTPMSGPGSGSEEATSGATESWTTRTDELVDIRLRFWEAEWSAVRAFVLSAQQNPSGFTFFPDKNVASSYACVLVSPKNGEKVAWERGDHPGTLELSLTIRLSTPGATFPATYFGA